MNTFVLTDLAGDLWVESFEHGPGTSGSETADGWSPPKRRLRGGRRDGVDLILVDNGSLSFSVIPTRGMGLWKGSYEGNRLGWDSPVADGPGNPALVHLSGLERRILRGEGPQARRLRIEHDPWAARQDRQHPGLLCGDPHRRSASARDR